MLLQFASNEVHVTDIYEYCPNEPGHPAYVRILTNVKESQRIPLEDCWFLTDAYCWVDFEPTNEVERERVRRYRFFINVVALLLFVGRKWPLILIPRNYVASHLLTDSVRFERPQLKILLECFGDCANALKADMEVEFLYFIFGEIVLLQRLGEYEAADAKAEQLMAEEEAAIMSPSQQSNFQDGRFLVGISKFTNHRSEWKRFVNELENPNQNKAIAEIKDAVAHGTYPESK